MWCAAKALIWANFIATSNPSVGNFPKWWWFLVREVSPKSPFFSGLGIIVICPDQIDVVSTIETLERIGLKLLYSTVVRMNHWRKLLQISKLIYNMENNHALMCRFYYYIQISSTAGEHMQCLDIVCQQSCV